MEAQERPFEFEEFFRANYGRIARAIARIIGDTGRAEDLAAESFWKLWRSPELHGEQAGAWLYRTAVRMGLNELRGKKRRSHYEGQVEHGPALLTPEEARARSEEAEHVRRVLRAMDPKQAELLLLRHTGLVYGEVAVALGLNAASVGTLIVRAQQAFRKEYEKQFGQR